MAKSPEEQGDWAAKSALRILDGTPVSSIAVAENKKGELISKSAAGRETGCDLCAFHVEERRNLSGREVSKGFGGRRSRARVV